MSAHYEVLPLAPIEPAWLAKMGLAIPENYENSRNPTAAEVRSVVKQLTEENYFSSEASFKLDGKHLVTWLNTNSQDDTLLCLEDYAEDNSEDTPCYLSFTYGSSEVAMVICERLARLCGPFLLIAQGLDLIIISPGTLFEADWVALDFNGEKVK